ncbi:MAG: O-antigen ligase family protein [Candidatus Wallbacteria bacterium]|nr:O-antigen ligase family protein [Candidatus Wallbacteria bacterium]
MKSAFFLALFCLFFYNTQYDYLHLLVSGLIWCWLLLILPPLEDKESRFLLWTAFLLVFNLMISATVFCTLLRDSAIAAGLTVFFSGRKFLIRSELGRMLDFILAGVMLIGLVQTGFLTSLSAYTTHGFFQNASFFGAFLLLNLSRVLDKKFFPWGLSYLICLAAAASRACWLGLASGLLLFAFSERRLKPLAYLLVFLSLILIGNISRAKLSQGISESNYAISRQEIWQNAWEQFKERPWFGNGWGSFSSLFLEHKPLIKLHAHSLYLELLSGFGICGVLILLWLSHRFMKNFVRSKQCLLALLPFFLASFFDNNFYSYQIVVIFFLVLLYFSIDEKEGESQKSQLLTDWEIKALLFYPFFFFAAIFIKSQVFFSLLPLCYLPLLKPGMPSKLLKKSTSAFIVCLIILVKISIYETGVDFMKNKDYSRALSCFSTSANYLWPVNPLELFYAGNAAFLQKSSWLGMASGYYNKGSCLYPCFDYWKVNLEISLGKAGEIQAFHGESLALAAVYYNKIGQFDKAQEFFRKACLVEPRTFFLADFKNEALQQIGKDLNQILKSLERNPENVIEHLKLAYYYLETGETESALKYSRLAREEAQNGKDSFLAESIIQRLTGKASTVPDSIDFNEEFPERVFGLRGLRRPGLVDMKLVYEDNSLK